jgi:hypothetical protein
MINISPVHVNLYHELLDVLRKYLANASAEEVLAVTANLTGKVMAMQNSQKFTSEQIMEIVVRNIRIGNQEMVDALLSAPAQGNA